MKTLIGEYGRVIVLTIISLLMIGFIFSHKGDGLLGLLEVVKPVATVHDTDSVEIVSDITIRKDPVLSVSTKKLIAGNTYNLLDKGTFQVTATNEEGIALPVTITKVIDPDKKDITKSIDPLHFQPKKGTYLVTYHTEEKYRSATKETTKTYHFVVD